MTANLDDRESNRLLYFAYGSNMCTARLKARVTSAVPQGIARLPGYELRFQKRSGDGSAKCNALLSSTSGAEVVGVVFEIAAEEKQELDAAEGLGYGYHEHHITVVTDEGESRCFVYLADRDAIDDSLKPYDWYKEFVVAGARDHGLPPDYVLRVEGVASLHDPDSKRDARERAILSRVHDAGR